MSEIDVILPTYNQCSFLNRAIDGILNQTFTNFKFIIVNDGSSDNTANILESYKSGRIHIIANNVNMGLPAALNIGHSRGASPYCTWVSTDNFSKPNHLQLLYDNIVKDNLDFIRSNFMVIDANQKSVSGVKKFRRIGTMGASFLYKRKVWETYHYDEKKQGLEDYKFYLQSFLHPFKIGFIEDVLVDYYRQGNSLSGRLAYYPFEELFKELQPQLEKHGIDLAVLSGSKP